MGSRTLRIWSKGYGSRVLCGLDSHEFCFSRHLPLGKGGKGQQHEGCHPSVRTPPAPLSIQKGPMGGAVQCDARCALGVHSAMNGAHTPTILKCKGCLESNTGKVYGKCHRGMSGCPARRAHTMIDLGRLFPR